MKVFIGLFLAAVVFVGSFSYSQIQQSNLLTQQIEDYARQNFQPLTLIENNSLKNIEPATTLRSLQDELKNRESQLAAFHVSSKLRSNKSTLITNESNLKFVNN